MRAKAPQTTNARKLATCPIWAPPTSSGNQNKSRERLIAATIRKMIPPSKLPSLDMSASLFPCRLRLDGGQGLEFGQAAHADRRPILHLVAEIAAVAHLSAPGSHIVADDALVDRAPEQCTRH